jgi:SAM-dependent methyltransferase
MTGPVDPDAFNAFEAAGWEERPAGYDDFFRAITTRVVGPLLDAAAVGPGARVLDVATGPGYVAAEAAARGAFVVGVDVAESMLALARRLHPELEFHSGDAESLWCRDGMFDAVVANFLLLHLGRPERAAAEFARVLTPGGRVALTVWDVPAATRFIGVGEFAALLRGAGFQDVEVRTEAFTHVEASRDSLWDGLLRGTVRMSALVLGQPEATRTRIRAAFDGLAGAYETGGHLALPVSVKLASGRKA